MDFSFLLAIWGSVLSTILAALRLLEFGRDRPRILVNLEEERRVYSPEHDYGNYSYICITLANRGRRPITVGCAGLILPKGSELGFIVHVDYLRPTASDDISEGKSRVYLVKEEDTPDFSETEEEPQIHCLRNQCYWTQILFRSLHSQDPQA